MKDATLSAIAAAYPPEARAVPVAERLQHFTIDQHLAWAMRFHPAIATREAIEAMHREAVR